MGAPRAIVCSPQAQVRDKRFALAANYYAKEKADSAPACLSR